MRKLIYVMLFAVLCTGLTAQKKDLVYIRIQEKIGGSGNALTSYMHINYPDQKSKYIDLKRLEEDGGNSEHNGKIIQKEISALLSEGYEINSASQGGDMNVSYTVMFLTRKKE